MHPNTLRLPRRSEFLQHENQSLRRASTQSGTERFLRAHDERGAQFNAQRYAERCSFRFFLAFSQRRAERSAQ